MTFSIVARSADGEAWGVAVASKFLGVGAAVPAARCDVGAIATQALANLTYRPRGLHLLSTGLTAQEVLDALTGEDDKRAERQAGIVDREGRAATYTGSECLPWAGGRTGDGYAIQGNILIGSQVVEEMERAWLSGDHGQPLSRRLLAALQAGDAAGGDRRGRQSAALLVASRRGGYGGGTDIEVDLRVDDHEAPCEELARLLDLHRIYFERPRDDDLVAVEGEVADEVRTHLSALGFEDLESWVGVHNYEMRVVGDRVDRFVLDRLREAAGGGKGGG